MDGLHIIVFFGIIVVLAFLWYVHKSSPIPETLGICICGHKKLSHISYANLLKKNYSTGKCDLCDCPGFVLRKGS